MNVELLILVDNVASQLLQAEHGLAVHISGRGKKILFDVAATSEALLHNALAMDVDLSSIDAVVVSHGHADHTGGLAAVAARRPALPIYIHPGAFNRRWADKPDEPMKDVSCPHSAQKLRQGGAMLRHIEAPEMLEDWLLLSGPIGGCRHGTESFVIRKGDDLVIDNFEDEMILLLRGRNGWVIVSGCCHRGLKNTLRAASFLTRNDPVVALVGGLHLRSASEVELEGAAALLAQFGCPDVYPCHCSGPQAVNYLTHRFPAKIHPLCAGAKVEF